MSDCIFCRIVNGEIPSELLYENEEVVAFRDIRPMRPVHILIVPRAHIQDILDLSKQADRDRINAAVLDAVAEITQKEGIDESGFSLITNCGSDGGQSVFHLHYHILGGAPLEWERMV
ncbi:MAG: histidine triad nucleotide-binding protein [Eubacteriales bacterium]|nr:histidine triad nucleotide-binding protein [Eubacteriales bacterium]